MIARDNLKGILWMIVHMSTAAMSSAQYRLLTDNIPHHTIAFVLNALGFISFLPFALMYRREILASTMWKIYVVRAIFTVIPQILLVYSYNNMHFAQVSAITLVYPLLCSAASFIVFKEAVGVKRVIALITGFLGAMIIINPTYDGFNKYSICVLIVAMLWVVYDLLTAQSGKTESLVCQSFFVLMFILLFSGIPASMTDFSDLSLRDITKFLYAAPIMALYFVSGIATVIYAAELSVIMPFYFLTLIVSGLVGYYVFGETVSLTTAIGGSIIVLSTTYIAYKEYQSKRLKRKQEMGRLI